MLQRLSGLPLLLPGLRELRLELRGALVIRRGLVVRVVPGDRAVDESHRVMPAQGLVRGADLFGQDPGCPAGRACRVVLVDEAKVDLAVFDAGNVSAAT